MAPITFSWVPQGSFHHVGFVVASIDAAIQGVAKSVDAEWDGEITHDPLQYVRVAFLRPKHAADPLVELVEPAGEKSPVLAFLQRGGGLHHLCYEVDQLDRQLETSRAGGGLVVRPPLPAVAFGGRRIAWLYTKEKLLIEYLAR
jgi:methylmalonyl-CoA/ethylmalonyl-CoA epimerase